MLLFPQVQERAQQEIGNVVGAGRLPTFEDLESIPYMKAMLFETLRWQPTIPLGLPHRSMEDDEYNGYLIPRGTDLYPVCHISHTGRLVELNLILICRMFGEQLKGSVHSDRFICCDLGQYFIILRTTQTPKHSTPRDT